MPQAQAEFTELNRLHAADEEQDFYLNIVHIQKHRRIKAIQRLRACVESGDIGPLVAAEYFLPMCDRIITDVTDLSEHNLPDHAIECMGVLCGKLEWPAYAGQLSLFLALLRRPSDIQKRLVRSIVAILEHFHFAIPDMDSPDAMAPDSQQVFRAATADDEVAGVAPDAAGGEEGMDVATDTVVEAGTDDAEEEFAGGIANPVVTRSAVTARDIHYSLSKDYLPQLERHLSYRNAERRTVLRPPVAVALIKLLLQLPRASMEKHMPRVVTKLVNSLRDKMQSARDTARSTMIDICVLLGPFYVPFVIGELRGGLRKGYMLHVLGFTVHAILDAMVGRQPFVLLMSCCPSLR